MTDSDIEHIEHLVETALKSFSDAGCDVQVYAYPREDDKHRVVVVIDERIVMADVIDIDAVERVTSQVRRVMARCL